MKEGLSDADRFRRLYKNFIIEYKLWHRWIMKDRKCKDDSFLPDDDWFNNQIKKEGLLGLAELLDISDEERDGIWEKANEIVGSFLRTDKLQPGLMIRDVTVNIEGVTVVALDTIKEGFTPILYKGEGNVAYIQTERLFIIGPQAV